MISSEPRATNLSIRVVQCPSCGAPLDVPLGGGTVRCAYCQTTSTLAFARPEPSTRKPFAITNDAFRLQKLREQMGDPATAGKRSRFSHEWLAPELRAVWNDAAAMQRAWEEIRARWRAPDAVDDEYTLCMVADGLAGHHFRAKKYVESRALIETALERVRDPGFRLVLYVDLVSIARNLGDLASAEAWLAQCEVPEPDDFVLEGSARLGVASVCVLRQDWEGVIRALGEDDAALPFLESKGSFALRIEALERLRRPDSADAQCRKALAMFGPEFDEMARRTRLALEALDRRIARLPSILPKAPRAMTPALERYLRKRVPSGRMFAVVIVVAVACVAMAFFAPSTGDPKSLVVVAIVVGVFDLLLAGIAFASLRAARVLRGVLREALENGDVVPVLVVRCEQTGKRDLTLRAGMLYSYELERAFWNWKVTSRWQPGDLVDLVWYPKGGFIVPVDDVVACA